MGWRQGAVAAVAVGLVFGLGWTGSALGRSSAPAPPAPPSAGLAEGDAGECSTGIDSSAMAANANLVRDVHDLTRRLAVAERRAEEAEAKVATAASGPGPRVLTSRDEWGRMAAEGRVRLRTPCDSWDSGGRILFYEAPSNGGFGQRIRMSRGGGAASVHVVASGLSSEEREELPAVYARLHDRTWASIRSTCEADPGFRESTTSESRSEDAPATSARRLAQCRSSIFGATDPPARAAIAAVASLRAAGAGSERAGNDLERVVFVLTDLPKALYDELARTYGREKATRLADNGAMCFDETIYDVRGSG